MGAGLDGGFGNEMFETLTERELWKQVADMQRNPVNNPAAGNIPNGIQTKTEQELLNRVPEIGGPGWDRNINI